MRSIVGLGIVAGLSSWTPGGALAQSSPKPPEAVADDALPPWRKAYERGRELSKDGRWIEALAAYEEAATMRDHPSVQHSIAVCQHSLGRYVAARHTLRRMLTDTTLSPTLVQEVTKLVEEMDRAVVRVAVTIVPPITVDPPVTTLAVDGRPLYADTTTGKTVFVALPAPAGAQGPQGSAFTVELDPGAHTFRASRPGHKDAFIPYDSRKQGAELELQLDLLPAHVAVSSEPAQAVVKVNGEEAGLAPRVIERPAGNYTIEVVRDGFETYVATFNLYSGQQADLTAKLVPVRLSVLKKWWFWTAAAVVVAGGAVLTYELTRPPPPYDGGKLGWVAKPMALRW
jgi:hypothetical protein